MKYALIAMAVIYLITFGCSPDEEKQAADSHGEASQAVVDATHKSEEAPAVAEHKEDAVAVHATAEKQDKSDGDHQEAAAEKAAPTEEAVQDEPATVAQPAEKSGDVVTEKAEEAAPVETAEQPAAAVAEEELVTMPCGQVIAKKDIPSGAPCLNYKAQGAPPSSEELNAAMLRMVEATNNMVKVTQQMVIATQEMINASKAAPVAAPESDKK
ncbi:MAG: hypothetical protein ACN4GW_02245 [Desulforhopalus sp.]